MSPRPTGATGRRRSGQLEARPRGEYGRALLELERLEDRLVVLVLVLEHHVVDVPVAQQRVGVVEVDGREPGEHPAADLVHDLAAFGAGPGSGSAPRVAPRMLEGIVHPRHLHELDRAVEVAGEPELLEVRDVTQVPEDRAHQRIVLGVQILVRQRATSRKVLSLASNSCPAMTRGSIRLWTAMLDMNLHPNVPTHAGGYPFL